MDIFTREKRATRFSSSAYLGVDAFLALGGLAVLGCIGLFFGIGLALAAHKFAVETNPKVEEVLEVLAGAQ